MHLKPRNYYKTVQLLEYITSENFDHVIITGDLTENSEPSAFEILRKLFKKFGLLDSNKLTLTIGNHDIYGGVHFAEDIINFPARCKKTDYKKKTAVFEGYFRETFSKSVSLKDSAFPSIKEFDDFILLNFNSIAKYSVFKNPFASKGEISENDIEAASKYLQKSKPGNKQKIVITHHHFCKDTLEENDEISSLWRTVERQTMKLKRKKKLLKSFKKLGINSVLHGHLHECATYTRKGIKFMNAGGSVLGSQNEFIKINIIKIQGNELKNEFKTISADTFKEPGYIAFSLAKLSSGSIRHKEQICLN